MRVNLSNGRLCRSHLLFAALLVTVMSIVVMGGVIGAEQGYEAESIEDTLFHLEGDTIHKGGETEQVGYEGSGLAYHAIGVILYASFHLAFLSATVYAMFFYYIGHLIPEFLIGLYFDAWGVVFMAIIAWGIIWDIRQIGSWWDSRRGG